MPWNSRFSFLDLLGAGLAVFLGAACGATPLQQAVKDISPRFEAKAPAVGIDELGGRWQAGWWGAPGQVLTNACYAFAKGEAPDTSWTRLRAKYDGQVASKARADFGPVLQIDSSASGTLTFDVELTDLKVASLHDVRFNPASACATDPVRGPKYREQNGFVEEVLTRAVVAGTISVREASSGQAHVQVDTNAGGDRAIHGSLSYSADGGTLVTGANLYFAHQPERFRISAKEQWCRDHPQGQPCAIDDCTLRIDGSGQGKWSGIFGCSNGARQTIMGGDLGLPMPLLTADGNTSFPPGVSHSVTVSPNSRVGFVDVHVVRWTALSLGQ